MNERRLRELMQEVPVPSEREAAERGLRIVRAAFAERGAPAPALRRPPRLALAIAGALLLLGLLLSPAGAKVRDWIDDVVTTGKKPSLPALTRVPGGGEILVESSRGAWIVHADGSRRLLGSYSEVTWSPHGLFVAATRGNTLSAVDPLGNLRWSISRPQPIDAPSWSPSGFRVAYLTANSLRVVNGDGTDDRLLRARVAPVAPAWSPNREHIVAYAEHGGYVRIVDADSGRKVGLLRPSRGRLLHLAWSTQGLLAVYDRAVVIDGSATFRPPAGGRFVTADFVGDTPRIAVLVRFGRSALGPPRSQIAIASTDRDTPTPVFSEPGTFSDLLSSPSGDGLLVAWRDADQWLFIPVRNRGRVIAVDSIARQFDPGAAAEPRFPSISGWCCPP